MRRIAPPVRRMPRNRRQIIWSLLILLAAYALIWFQQHDTQHQIGQRPTTVLPDTSHYLGERFAGSLRSTSCSVFRATHRTMTTSSSSVRNMCSRTIQRRAAQIGLRGIKVPGGMAQHRAIAVRFFPIRFYPRSTRLSSTATTPTLDSTVGILSAPKSAHAHQRIT